MARFSFHNALTNELAIGRMRRALAPFRNIDLRCFQLAAYHVAGIDRTEADRFDQEALRIERLRRQHAGKPTLAGELAEGAATLAALGSLVALILLLTPSAGHAAEAVGQAPIGVLGDLLMIIACAVFGSALVVAFVHWAFPMPTPIAPYDDEDDFGDHGTPPQWRR